MPCFQSAFEVIFSVASETSKGSKCPLNFLQSQLNLVVNNISKTSTVLLDLVEIVQEVDKLPGKVG